MLRFKLANGGTIASCKQPLQNKDFDRIEISDNYDEWYDNNGTFDDHGGPPDGDIIFNVKLYNPSTHTIRKSWCKNYDSRPIIQFGTCTYGDLGTSHGRKQAYGSNIVLSELEVGDTLDINFRPDTLFTTCRSHIVNPFSDNWYGEDTGIPEDQSLEPYENFYNDYFYVDYELHLVYPPRNKPAQENRYHYGGGFRKVRIVSYQVTYAIH